MAIHESVTQWIERLKDGDEAALSRLHERYWPFLLGLARRKTLEGGRRAEDEEDIAQEAFFGFYRSLKDGRVPQLNNRDDLVSLLVVITARRASDHFERSRAQKRGGGRVGGESVLEAYVRATEGRPGMGRSSGSLRSPEEEAILQETYQHYLAELPDSLQPFAELYLAGYTQDEIAGAMDCVDRTVRRKLGRLLDIWRKMAAKHVTEAPGLQ